MTFFPLQKEAVEGKPLYIPTLEEEMSEYASKNGFRPGKKKMSETRKTQRSQNVVLPQKKKPLPSMEVLKNLSQRLEAAVDASIQARKGQKVG